MTCGMAVDNCTTKTECLKLKLKQSARKGRNDGELTGMVRG